MESGGPGVQPGMDVYDSNQDKIGSVGSVNPTGSSTGTVAAGVSNEQRGGLLGDESAVGSSPGVGGGPGALGDESAVGRTPSVGGGTGTLGDESDVSDSDGSVMGSSPAGMPDMGAGDAGDLVVETIEVDVIPVNPGESGTITSDTGDYEPNPYEGMPGYFTVDESAGLGGLIGMHGKTLEVPYAAIMSVNPGQSVTLSVTKDEAERLYSREPQTPTMNP